MSRENIVGKTHSQFRTFIDELLNGTTNYRSLHSLTEQVEHQYHDRFLVELLQNAHDALSEGADGQRVAVVYAEDEGDFGALYVANDGNPISDSNFTAISNLGQSDKDPQESIGNKGIGFRSVLEITSRPHIYSRSGRESELFDGYCFRFDPDVLDQLGSALLEIQKGNRTVDSPIDDAERLYDWDETRFANFQTRFSGSNSERLKAELCFLSPYVMPVPLGDEDITEQVSEFQEQGFSTVIRLPLESAKAKKAVLEKVREIEASSILFLDKLSGFTVSHGDIARTIRKERTYKDFSGIPGYEIELSEADESGFETDRWSYWVWQRTIGGSLKDDEKEKIKQAVAELPGNWPSVDEATVSLAVQKESRGCLGTLNIYLPTRVDSGCGAHISGPFHGDMSRTSIDFDNPFNKLLFDTLAELAVDVVFDGLAGKGLPEFEAILDMVSASEGEEGEHWRDVLEQKLAARKIELSEANILLTDRGWSNAQEASLVPSLESPEAITSELLREFATFPVIEASRIEKIEQVELFFESIDVPEHPIFDDRADTVQAIAGYLHVETNEVDWNGFWRDIEKMFRGNLDSLKSKKLLLGTDGQLHAGDESSSIFFRPRSAGDDDEVDNVADVILIPESLRDSVAFLSEEIEVLIPREGGGVKNTSVHGFLAEGLVETYGIERIFSSVLIRAIPGLPVKYDSPDSELCRDILHWALNLLISGKGEHDEAVRRLGQIPVPCNGGWYPINRASFGTGWEGKHGEALEGYLISANSKACRAALEQVLLPPDHQLWGDLAARAKIYLEAAGLFDGLRLLEIGPEEWSAEATASKVSGFILPEIPPPGVEKDLWSSYRNHTKQNSTVNYTSNFKYEVRPMHTLPGLDKWSSLERPAKIALTQLLVVSIPQWATRWTVIYPIRVNRSSRDQTHFQSLVRFFLENYPWLSDEIEGELVSFRPSDRWYVPRPLRLGGIHQFSHLSPYPPSIASLIGSDPAIEEAMIELDMPVYAPGEMSDSPDLIEALTRALQDPAIDILNMSVFLGQLRSAWESFEPVQGQGPIEPLVVSKGAGSLHVALPSQLEPIYVPDASHQVHRGLESHSKPLLAIEMKDAKRLREYFAGAYEGEIRFASNLEQTALVDGLLWEEGRIHASSIYDELPWLVSLVLTTVAFSGTQSRGIGSKRFSEQLETLRNIYIVWVDSLEVCWRYEGELESQVEASAIYIEEDATIIARSEIQDDLSELAEVLSSIVGRADIEIPLKLLLNDRSVNVEYADEELCSVLRKINIQIDEYEQVQQRCLGDFAWRQRLWRPLILMFLPKAQLDRLEAVRSFEEFRLEALRQGFPEERFEEAARLVNASSSFKSLGYDAWQEFGEIAQLEHWNSFLSELGESSIRSEGIPEDFRESIGLFALLYRQLARELTLKGELRSDFESSYDEFMNMQCPTDYVESYWELPIEAVARVLAELLARQECPNEVVGQFIEAESIGQLRRGLGKIGYELNADPLEIMAQNRRLLSGVIEQVQAIFIAYATKQELDVGLWKHDKSVLLERVLVESSSLAILQNWSEQECISILITLRPGDVDSDIWRALNKACSVTHLGELLNVSPDDVVEADKVVEEYREAESRRESLVDVCGSEFQNTSNNLPQLWEHISGTITDDMLPPLDIQNSAELEEQSSAGHSTRKRRPPSAPGNRKKKSGRMTQDMKDLVGLAGEIHAFRTLRSNYGVEVVTPSAWISENSRQVYPDNYADDGRGCDFELIIDGKTHYFEVKASVSDDESFELGSSEIRLALESANRRNRRFTIIHIVNALTKAPTLRVLPNPYDRNQQKKYRFEEAGLRVRYSLTY